MSFSFSTDEITFEALHLISQPQGYTPNNSNTLIEVLFCVWDNQMVAVGRPFCAGSLEDLFILILFPLRAYKYS